MKKLYVVGSLSNPEIPVFAERLRAAGFDVFDDWFSPGPETDKFWTQYEKGKRRSYIEALNGKAAAHNFGFDLRHLQAADIVVLVMPAGKSAHLELGYAIGLGKPGYILMPEEPEKWDLMHRFATGIYSDEGELISAIKSGGRNVHW